MEHSSRHPRLPQRRRTPSPTKTIKSSASSASSCSPSKVTISKASSPRRPASRNASSSSSSSGLVLQALDANAKSWQTSPVSPKHKGRDGVEKVYMRSSQAAIPTLSPRRSDSQHVKVYVDRTDTQRHGGSTVIVSDDEDDDDEKENIPPESTGTESQHLSRSPSPMLKTRNIVERKVFADVPISDPRRRFELHHRKRLIQMSDLVSDAEIHDDDDDDLPVYVTPARPHIRKFQIGDYLGPMLASRDNNGWPLSAPMKANGNFDIVKLDDVLGDTRRKIRFDIFVDSDANKENVEPMEVTV
ncbi:hypothetical protein V1525DRAFT_10062 [Lipomyces kononenkoae]|uniref:Uncharacterized protein n=1 Tax=Lipomyces kononenkoae TaxID=34357 RepID=A0ACC3TD86_LIPKO